MPAAQEQQRRLPHENAGEQGHVLQLRSQYTCPTSRMLHIVGTFGRVHTLDADERQRCGLWWRARHRKWVCSRVCLVVAPCLLFVLQAPHSQGFIDHPGTPKRSPLPVTLAGETKAEGCMLPAVPCVARTAVESQNQLVLLQCSSMLKVQAMNSRQQDCRHVATCPPAQSALDNNEITTQITKARRVTLAGIRSATYVPLPIRPGLETFFAQSGCVGGSTCSDVSGSLKMWRSWLFEGDFTVSDWRLAWPTEIHKTFTD
eukprot:354140-Chlamydomonas_euryale.AAC.3